MKRMLAAGMLPMLVTLALLGAVSCRSVEQVRKQEVPWTDLTPTALDYIDSDGFDALLETALVNQDPAIIVRTGRSKPDWEARLNAWIAAWNRGDGGGRRPKLRGQAPDEPPATVRGQAPLAGVPLNGESIREVRLLVGGLLDRVEELAQSGSTWWREERARSRRVALLRPYSLRFHLDDEKLLQLVLFHGDYASYYPRFLQLLMHSNAVSDECWTRGVECSCARGRGEPVTGQLTSRGAGAR